MKVTRMDLDGAGSPMGLVAKILKAEPDMPLQTPIEALARQLDITEIQELTADGFEGGLITDEARSRGFILVKRGAREQRRRFTIGHELGHFLMTSHKPPPSGFRCSREDLRRWNEKDQGAHPRMEVEANQFSALILMPPPRLKFELAKFGEPDLAQIVSLAGTFNVSLEAAARAFATYNEEPVAIVVAQDRRIDKIYRSPSRFPWLAAQNGDDVPKTSLLFTARQQLHHPTEIGEARPEAWLESEWGKRMPGLFEQVFFQQDGYALILLIAEVADDEEEDSRWENKTSKERLREQQGRWGSDR